MKAVSRTANLNNLRAFFFGDQSYGGDVEITVDIQTAMHADALNH
jgi:hypothetical protein